MTVREVLYSTRFMKDYKRIKKRGWDTQKLKDIVSALAHEHKLPENARVHRLRGQYQGMWDAHIAPDWILIYEIDGDSIILRRTGTHSDLF